MEYTSEFIDSVVRENLKRVPWSFCMNAVSLPSAPSLDRIRNIRIVDIFRHQADLLCIRCGTCHRKSVGGIAEELSSREMGWKDINGDMSEINATIGNTEFNIFYNRGIEIRLLVNDTLASLSNPVHCTADVGDIVDFLEFIAKVRDRFDLLLKEKCRRAQKSKIISDIEYPFIEQKVQEYLVRRNICYSLFQREDKIFLEVQIIKEMWMSRRVTSGDIEKVLSIVPYLVKRPDCIRKDGIGFEVIHKYKRK